tara:strand:- start:427 stop:1347 length:921 start_codon:yes stop_codon:yes gene_type:complete
MASLAAAVQSPTEVLAQKILRIVQSQSERLPQEDSDLRTAMLEKVDAIIKYLEALLASEEPTDFDSYLESIIPLFVHFNEIANEIAALTASAPEEILPEICKLKNLSYNKNQLKAHKQNFTQLDKVLCALDLIAMNDDLSETTRNTYIFNQECWHCVEVKDVIKQQGGKYVVVLYFNIGIGLEDAYNAKLEDVEFRCRSGRSTLSTMHPKGTKRYETTYLQAVFRPVDDESSNKYFLETCFPISSKACIHRSPPEPHKMVSDIISFQKYLFVFFKESDEDRIIKSARLLLRVFTEWMGSEPKALFE